MGSPAIGRRAHCFFVSTDARNLLRSAANGGGFIVFQYFDSLDAFLVQGNVYLDAGSVKAFARALIGAGVMALSARAEAAKIIATHRNRLTIFFMDMVLSPFFSLFFLCLPHYFMFTQVVPEQPGQGVPLMIISAC